MHPDAQAQARVHRVVGIGNGHGCFVAASGERKIAMDIIDVRPWSRICVAN